MRAVDLSFNFRSKAMTRERRSDQPTNHPWADLEESFQTIAACSDRRSEELERAARLINAAILKAASQILGSPHHRHLLLDPQDLAHMWWIRMLAGGFDRWEASRGHLYAYCYPVLRNLCLDAARRGRLRQTRQLSADRIVGGWDPCEAAQSNEQRRRVRAAVRRLPKHLCEVVELRFFEGRSPQEAAEICGTTRNTIIWRTYAARRLLKKLLGD
jgi:RNA polymerase sigma factor (sigma-70 family)